MQVNIRINDELYKKLRELAKKEHRTITAQLDILLSSMLETQENNSIETPKKKRRTIIGDYNNNNSNNIEENIMEEGDYDLWN